MSFETSFLSTSTTSRKVAAKITNVTQSTSQTLALSFAGNSYTLTELSTVAGDTVVITFYYTDGESSSDNRVRVKQHGGSSATATIGGIILGGSITSVQNQALSGNPTLSGFPNPSTNNTFSISTSTQAISSTLHEVLEINSADPGDRYQVGFSFTVPTGITKIEIDNDDDEDGESYVTNLNFPIGVGTGVTAPTASSVTFNDPTSLNTTATVNLSASGSGGTLQYACEVGDTTPDNWQSSNTFTITRGSGTVYARARRSTTAVSNTVNASRPPFLTLGGNEEVGNQIISSSFTGNLSVTISNSTQTLESFAIATSASLTDAQVDSQAIVSGTSGIPVSLAIPSANLPSAGNTNTFYLYGKRTGSTGGNDLYSQIDTFTVQRQTPGGSGGSGTYGLEVTGPNGTTTVFGTNLLATNFVVAQAFSLTGGQTTTVTCADANDTSKVLIFFAEYERGITVSTTSTNFTLTNTSTSSFARSGTVFAIRKR